jgi:hypothetical protein
VGVAGTSVTPRGSCCPRLRLCRAPKRREYEEKLYGDQDAAANLLTNHKTPPEFWANNGIRVSPVYASTYSCVRSQAAGFVRRPM